MPSSRPLPAATPVLVAAVLAAAAFFGVAHVVPLRAGGGPLWPSAFWIAALGFVLAYGRAQAPAPAGLVASTLRVAAATATAALLIRVADGALIHATIELPSSAPVVGRLDVSECLMGVLLLLPALGSSHSAAIRGPRPGVLLPALGVLGWLGWIVAGSGVRLLPAPDAPTLDVLPASSLVWIGALAARPGLIPGPGRMARAGRIAAPLVGALVFVLLAGVVLPKAGSMSTGAPAFAAVGSDLGLPYGAGRHVGSGAQTAACVIGAWFVIVSSCRGAARATPAVGAWLPVAVAFVAWTTALWFTQAALLSAAALTGLVTALVGLGDGTPEDS